MLSKYNVFLKNLSFWNHMIIWESSFSFGKSFYPSHLQKKIKDPWSLRKGQSLFSQYWKYSQSAFWLRLISLCLSTYISLQFFQTPSSRALKQKNFLFSCIIKFCFRISFSSQNLTFTIRNRLNFHLIIIALFILFFSLCALAIFCWNNNNNINNEIQILVTWSLNLTEVLSKQFWNSINLYRQYQ